MTPENWKAIRPQLVDAGWREVVNYVEELQVYEKAIRDEIAACGNPLKHSAPYVVRSADEDEGNDHGGFYGEVSHGT